MGKKGEEFECKKEGGGGCPQAKPSYPSLLLSVAATYTTPLLLLLGEEELVIVAVVAVVLPVAVDMLVVVVAVVFVALDVAVVAPTLYMRSGTGPNPAPLADPNAAPTGAAAAE